MNNFTPADLDCVREFGEWVHRTREKLELNQVEVSQAAGITQAALSRIEAGINAPTLTVILNLCMALNVDPKEFTTPYIAKRKTPQP